MKKYLILFSSLVLLFSSGCYTISSMQTAKTTPRNEFSYAAGVSLSTEQESEGGYLFSYFGLGNYVPNPEFSLRYGLSDKLDIGAKVGIAHFQSDLKLNLFATDSMKFYISTGLAYIGDGGFGSGIELPLYLSYYPSKHFFVYLNPEVRVTQYNPYSTFATISSGGSFGLAFNLKNKKSIFLEISYLNYQETPTSWTSKWNDNHKNWVSFNVIQFAVGVFLNNPSHGRKKK